MKGRHRDKERKRERERVCGGRERLGGGGASKEIGKPERQRDKQTGTY